jgi:hypothetical protein
MTRLNDISVHLTDYTTLIKAIVPPHRDFGITLSPMRGFKPRQVTKANPRPISSRANTRAAAPTYSAFNMKILCALDWRHTMALHALWGAEVPLDDYP